MANVEWWKPGKVSGMAKDAYLKYTETPETKEAEKYGYDPMSEEIYVGKKAMEGAAQGATVGTAVGVPGVGTLIGGAIGMGLGGAIAIAELAIGGSPDLKMALDRSKSDKDRKKMADQAAKAQFQAQKSRAGKKKKPSNQSGIAEYDDDIMRLAKGEATRYDQFITDTYG